jgi:hypothetical protein
MARRTFSTALRELAEKDSLSGDEDAISELLSLIIRQVCFNFNRSRDNEEIRVPIWEAPIQPVNRGELRGGKRRKRPDFICNYFNSHAVSADELIGIRSGMQKVGQPHK